MENIKFTLDSGNTKYDVVFEDGKISARMLMVKLKECKYEDVKKVSLKKAFLGGGSIISFRIHFMKNGKEETFPWIDAMADEHSTNACLDHMKHTFSSDVIWDDQRHQIIKDSTGKNQYDLQFQFLLAPGYGLITLPRAVQLGIYTVITSFFIIPLPYFLKIWFTGGYRVYADESGLEVRKFLSKKWKWEEIDKIEAIRWKIFDANTGSKQRIMNFKVHGKSGKTASFIMRTDNAIAFIKEMAQHHLVNPQLAAQYM